MTDETVQSLVDSLRPQIAEQLGVSVDQVTDTAKFEEDLNADSLETLKIIQLVEESAGIEVPDDKAEGLHSLADLKEYLKGCSENRNSRQ